MLVLGGFLSAKWLALKNVVLTLVLLAWQSYIVLIGLRDAFKGLTPAVQEVGCVLVLSLTIYLK